MPMLDYSVGTIDDGSCHRMSGGTKGWRGIGKYSVPSKSNSRPLQESTSGGAEKEGSCIASDPIANPVF
jgi:hypothetical protein